MKIKAACIGTGLNVVSALSSTAFANRVLSDVVGNALGVENVLERPAEYYVQNADTGPAPKSGVMGVEVRLSGVTRDGRKSKQFHNAIKTLDIIVQKTVEEALQTGERCQVFCVIMLDGEVETSAGSGIFSQNIEGVATWVSKVQHCPVLT